MREKALIAVLLAAIAVAGCQKASEQSAISGAGGFRVETLFTHEGCTLYRFWDARAIYYSNCNGGTQWDESVGKTRQDFGVSTNKGQP